LCGFVAYGAALWQAGRAESQQSMQTPHGQHFPHGTDAGMHSCSQGHSHRGAGCRATTKATAGCPRNRWMTFASAWLQHRYMHAQLFRQGRDTSTTGCGGCRAAAAQHNISLCTCCCTSHLLDGVGSCVAAVAPHHEQHVHAPHVHALDNLPASGGKQQLL
jgi:hypothetical protein